MHISCGKIDILRPNHDLISGTTMIVSILHVKGDTSDLDLSIKDIPRWL